MKSILFHKIEMLSHFLAGWDIRTIIFSISYFCGNLEFIQNTFFNIGHRISNAHHLTSPEGRARAKTSQLWRRSRRRWRDSRRPTCRPRRETRGLRDTKLPKVTSRETSKCSRCSTARSCLCSAWSAAPGTVSGWSGQSSERKQRLSAGSKWWSPDRRCTTSNYCPTMGPGRKVSHPFQKLIKLYYRTEIYLTRITKLNWIGLVLGFCSRRMIKRERERERGKGFVRLKPVKTPSGLLNAKYCKSETGVVNKF